MMSHIKQFSRAGEISFIHFMQERELEPQILSCVRYIYHVPILSIYSSFYLEHVCLNIFTKNLVQRYTGSLLKLHERSSNQILRNSI